MVDGLAAGRQRVGRLDDRIRSSVSCGRIRLLALVTSQIDRGRRVEAYSFRPGSEGRNNRRGAESAEKMASWVQSPGPSDLCDTPRSPRLCGSPSPFLSPFVVFLNSLGAFFSESHLLSASLADPAIFPQ